MMQYIMTSGADKTDRTGTGTRSIPGYMMRFNLGERFPLLTTKKVHLHSVIYELFWFLSGNTNIRYLKENKVKIWDEWADENGELGPVYGHQWRHWQKRNGGEIDQIANLIKSIKTNPDGRRHIVSAWNPEDVDKMALPPCHCLFQFYIALGRLTCLLYQRSADTFLGIPFNIASYALLTRMVAQVCGLLPGEFVWIGGDVHIYNNHFDQVKLQLSRTPRELPTLEINPEVSDIFSFKYEDFKLVNYNPYPVISAPIAV